MHKKYSRQKGFTLIELLVTLFIFALLMTVASEIFSRAFGSFRNNRNIQRDLENVQYMTGIMAKELRTSTIVNPNTVTSSTSSVQFYDHSQGKCFRYRISSGALQVASGSASDVSSCNSMSFSVYTNVSTGTVSGSFSVVPSDDSPKRVGKVTLTLRVQEGASHQADIQTTVSLRDFGSEGSDL